jgi:hypothetical protein
MQTLEELVDGQFTSDVSNEEERDEEANSGKRTSSNTFVSTGGH